MPSWRRTRTFQQRLCIPPETSFSWHCRSGGCINGVSVNECAQLCLDYPRCRSFSFESTNGRCCPTSVGSSSTLPTACPSYSFYERKGITRALRASHPPPISLSLSLSLSLSAVLSLSLSLARPKRLGRFVADSLGRVSADVFADVMDFLTHLISPHHQHFPPI